MQHKTDDFKARSLALLGHSEAWRLTTRDRDILWKLAFNTREMTARDQSNLAAVVAKIEGEAVA